MLEKKKNVSLKKTLLAWKKKNTVSFFRKSSESVLCLFYIKNRSKEWKKLFLKLEKKNTVSLKKKLLT